MELKCNKNDLNNALNIASRGIASKTTLSILECVLLSASGDVAKLNATNTELNVETVFEADIKTDGAVCIDAKLFSDVVRKLPDGEVSIKTDEVTATIKCGKSKFKLNVRDSSEFPSLDEVDKTNVLKMTQESLKDLISQTIFSVSQNSANKLMTGVCLKVVDNKLTMTALDGHRVAIREWQTLCDDMCVVVPSKALMELSKVLTEGDIDIYYTSSATMFEFDGTIISTRLIEGDYFDTSKMLTNDHTLTVKADRKALIDCFDRATLLIKEADRKPVIVTVADTMNIKIETPIGSMNEDIEAQAEGEQIVIGLNPRFMLDALRVIADNMVTIYFQNPKAPCYIKGDDYNYVILPVQFREV